MRRYKKQISRIVTIAMLFAFLVGILIWYMLWIQHK